MQQNERISQVMNTKTIISYIQYLDIEFVCSNNNKK